MKCNFTVFLVDKYLSCNKPFLLLFWIYFTSISPSLQGECGFGVWFIAS